jgi:DNA topoisomerase-1
VPKIDEVCDKCGLPMLLKTGRFGRFIACSGYPKCKHTKPLNDGTGMGCPQCGEGQTVKRRGKRGRSFYACDKYPACDFTAPGKPIAKSCPDCNARYLVEKKLKSGVTWACASPGCGHQEKPSELLADLKGA